MDPIPESDDVLSVRDGYAAWAPCYDDDGNPLLPLEGEAVRGLFGPILGKRVLDLGCGTGRHTLALAQAGAHVTALDQSEEMIALARPKLQGHSVNWVLHALPDPLPFASNTFALAVLGLVVEHIADLRGLLVDVARVLAPGGRCVLSALHPERTAEGQRARFIDPRTGLRRPITTYHRSLAEYRRAATHAGLVVVTEQTLVVPAELAASLPRARRYVGLPLGWVLSLAKAGSATVTSAVEQDQHARGDGEQRHDHRDVLAQAPQAREVDKGQQSGGDKKGG
jgi:SAM-dependent methyltransferase